MPQLVTWRGCLKRTPKQTQECVDAALDVGAHTRTTLLERGTASRPDTAEAWCWGSAKSG